MTATGPYVKVYQSIVDDPMFEKVYGNDKMLATWLRMLLVADAMYPASAPMPPRTPTVSSLIDCGLVLTKPSNRYTMRGLAKDRERRSAHGRNAAEVRWHSGSNADAMPSKAEQNRAEQSNGVGNAHEGEPAVFMGYKPRATKGETEADLLADIERQHQESVQQTIERQKQTEKPA